MPSDLSGLGQYTDLDSKGFDTLRKDAQAKVRSNRTQIKKKMKAFVGEERKNNLALVGASRSGALAYFKTRFNIDNFFSVWTYMKGYVNLRKSFAEDRDSLAITFCKDIFAEFAAEIHA
ncbi:uncharacterized protein MYCGRDRAFT_92883 [Zymoseptoria tritici IPO323]|uniref:Uncharacterized protein n=1 Tax=Zymoseptoria tritici (strain CBS 115943 / IPO323) TaxID=336722 RepID=F9X984_ZYMTI|nr:uncharacterized protein MYCGRDRAFT_92883 [Zymoseptoria tritici IPO323]EGP88196.1 hypothetical protein MYCGRDRAFT_92883 [Zymoseptoria tritici IPO323]